VVASNAVITSLLIVDDSPSEQSDTGILTKEYAVGRYNSRKLESDVTLLKQLGDEAQYAVNANMTESCDALALRAWLRRRLAESRSRSGQRQSGRRNTQGS
jgi:hypothetical protein